MIDIEVYGIDNTIPPSGRRQVAAEIKKALSGLPKEIVDECFVVIDESTRTPANDPETRSPLICIVACDDDVFLPPLLHALDPLRQWFDIRLEHCAEILRKKP